MSIKGDAVLEFEVEDVASGVGACSPGRGGKVEGSFKPAQIFHLAAIDLELAVASAHQVIASVREVKWPTMSSSFMLVRLTTSMVRVPSGWIVV